MTIRRQTFENKTDKNGTNTIAAEFRVGGDTGNALKRTAQNFRMDIQTGGNSGGGHAGSGSGGSGRGASNGGETAVVSSATAVMRLVDDSGNPLSGTVLELHSTPQTAHTNRNGIAVFEGVTAGQHTLYVKNSLGNTLCSRDFELLFGEKVFINEKQVCVKAGSAFTLQVQMSGNELLFLGVQEGDVYQVASAGTGDDMGIELWMALLLLTCGMGYGIYIWSRNKRMEEKI